MAGRKLYKIAAMFTALLLATASLFASSPKAHAEAHITYFSIGAGDSLVGGYPFSISSSSDKADTTEIEWSRLEFSTDKSLWRDISSTGKLREYMSLDFIKHYNYTYMLPIEPGITSVYLKLTQQYNPWIGSRSVSSYVIGPIQVKQPLPATDFKAVPNDKGSITLSWQDNANFEDSYVIYRSDGEVFTVFNSGPTTGPITFEDTTGMKPLVSSEFDYQLEMFFPGVNPPIPKPPLLSAHGKSKPPIKDIVKIDAPYVTKIGDLIKGQSKPSDKLIKFKDNAVISKIGDVIISKNPPATGGPDLTGASDWAKPEITQAAANNLTTPQSLGDYTLQVTRETFAGLAVKLYEALSGKKADPVSPNPFKDTNNNDVLKAFKLGIVGGVTDDTFAPAQNITRQEISVMIMRTLKAAKPAISFDVSGAPAFADDDQIASWAFEAVKFAAKNGIMNGVGDNKIDPLGNTTREQAIVLSGRTYLKFK